jgi:hypothetical protein
MLSDILARQQLAVVLVQLERQQKTGVLTVASKEKYVTLSFQQGAIAWFSTQQQPAKLGDWLVMRDILPAHDLQIAINNIEYDEKTPGYYTNAQLLSTLFTLNYLHPEQFFQCIQNDLTAIISAMLTWSEAKITFYEGAQSSIDHLPVTFTPTSLIPALLASDENSRMSFPTQTAGLLNTPLPLSAEMGEVPETPQPLLSIHTRTSDQSQAPHEEQIGEKSGRQLLIPPALFKRAKGKDSSASHIALIDAPTTILQAIRLPFPADDPTLRTSAVKHSTHRIPAWEMLIIGVVLLIAGMAHGINMFHYPYFEDDEGTYMSQAWAVVHLGRLAYYTYWYDHAPAGWLQIGLWAVITGGFHTFGSPLYSGRIFMLVLQLGSTFILYRITRKISNSVLIAVVVTLLFALSPYGIYYHRRVLLDNITTFWMLLSILQLLTRPLSLKKVAFSACAFAISILSKEVTVFAIPACAILVFLSAEKANRRFAIVIWVAIVCLIVSFYPLMAIVKGELFPSGTLLGGTNPHVSLLGSVGFQGSRGKDGGLLSLRSNFWMYMGTWVKADPLLVIGGGLSSIFTVFTLKKYPLIGVMGLISLSLWAFLARGGILIAFYLIPLLPLLALNLGCMLWLISRAARNILQYCTHIKVVSVVGEHIVLLSCLALLLICVPGPKAGFGFGASPGDPNNPYIDWNSKQTDAQMEADTWVEAHLPHNSRMVIDMYMWPDLYTHGFGSAYYYWKVETDPSIQINIFHNNWRNIDYVITTYQVLEDTDNQNWPLLKTALQHSTVIKTFDTGGWPVIIRKVNK